MGLKTAQILSSRGALISLADINEEAMRKAVATLKNPDDHLCTVVDVRKGDSVNDWISATVSKFGRLDGAVNMAGIVVHAMPVAEVTEKDWDMTFDVNTRGVFFCLRAQIRAMLKGGSIVSLIFCSFRKLSCTS